MQWQQLFLTVETIHIYDALRECLLLPRNLTVEWSGHGYKHIAEANRFGNNMQAKIQTFKPCPWLQWEKYQILFSNFKSC